MNPDVLLSAIIFLPALGALILAFLDSRAVSHIRAIALGFTVAELEQWLRTTLIGIPLRRALMPHAQGPADRT